MPVGMTAPTIHQPRLLPIQRRLAKARIPTSAASFLISRFSTLITVHSLCSWLSCAPIPQPRSPPDLPPRPPQHNQPRFFTPRGRSSTTSPRPPPDASTRYLGRKIGRLLPLNTEPPLRCRRLSPPSPPTPPPPQGTTRPRCSRARNTSRSSSRLRTSWWLIARSRVETTSWWDSATAAAAAAAAAAEK